MLGFVFMIIGWSGVFGDLSWFFSFLSMDIVGSVGLLLVFMRLGVIPPFWIYKSVYNKVFSCTPIVWAEFQTPVGMLKFVIPCWVQNVAFLLWAIGISFMFLERWPYINRITKTIAEITGYKIYTYIMFIKVIAATIILASSSTISIYVAAVIAIFIMMLDMITVLSVKIYKETSSSLM